MFLKVKPTPVLKGHVSLPASKSYSIRAFMIASCGGVSRILYPSDCDDAQVAIAMAKRLGAKIRRINKKEWVVHARPTSLLNRTMNVKESGTVLRFLLPLLALYGKKVVVKGEGTLKGRPNHHLTEVLRKNGVNIRGKGKKESIPITINGGKFSPRHISIKGTLSSQFISALLIACPRCEHPTKISITGKKIVSTDYIKMTLQVLKSSGVVIRKAHAREFRIPGGQKFKGLQQFHVPSDYGLASFLMAACILQKSKVTLQGYFNDKFIQADGRIFSLLKAMGVSVKKTAGSIKLEGPYQLKGGAFSLQSCPDLVPIMSILALFAKGKTRLYNIQHARAKESDRITDLRKELVKIGAVIKESQNELIIYPQKQYRKNIVLDPYHDHRLAMAFSILGIKIGVIVKDIECVHKSYPRFISDFKKMGAHLTSNK